MKWNDINKTLLPEPISEGYRLTHDAQSEGHILLFGFDKINFSPTFIIIRDDDLAKNIVKDTDNFYYNDTIITHWMSVSRPHSDNTEGGL